MAAVLGGLVPSFSPFASIPGSDELGVAASGALVPSFDPFATIPGSTDLGVAALGGLTSPLPLVEDTTAPTIGNFDPPSGDPVNATDPISFDITDVDSGGLFTGIVVFVSYEDGSTDVIHDGTGFRGEFVGGPNVRIPIVGGYRYTVRPANGWADSPTFEFLAIDQGGNLGEIA